MMLKIIKETSLDKEKRTLLLVFHDSNKSGGTMALLDLIDSWLLMEKYNIICMFPKSKGNAIAYLYDKSVMIMSYPYWQSVKKGNERIFTLVKKYIEFVVSYFITLYICNKFLKKINIDVVYSNTSAIFNGCWISQLLHKPHLWHIREFMSQEHMIVSLIGEKNHYRYISKHASTLIVISNALLKNYQNFSVDTKVVRIYDDVSNRYILDDMAKWEEYKNNILFVGNIMWGKGQHIAIKALHYLKKYGMKLQLFLVGAIEKENEEYYQYLLQLINKYELEDQVQFMGYVDDMNELRRTMGIGIVASVKEAFGRVTIEGMLAGLVMLGARDAGTSELIQDKENGFLFDVNDEIELAKIIHEVMCSSEEYIENIRSNAVQFGKQFTIGKCAKSVEYEIDKLI